jgi:phosphopentomutase
MKPLRNKQLADAQMNYYNIVVYHKSRKVFRLFTQSQRSKWNKVLKYCSKSLEFADSDAMIDRTLNEYVKSKGTYTIFYTNDDLSEYRSLEDIADAYPHHFI